MTIQGKRSTTRMILELVFYLLLAWIAIEAIFYFTDIKADGESIGTRHSLLYPLLLGAVAFVCFILAKKSIFDYLSAQAKIELKVEQDAIVMNGKSIPITADTQADFWALRANSRKFTMKLIFADGSTERLLSSWHQLDVTVRELAAQLPEQVAINFRQPPALRWMDKLQGMSIPKS